MAYSPRIHCVSSYEIHSYWIVFRQQAHAVTLGCADFNFSHASANRPANITPSHQQTVARLLRVDCRGQLGVRFQLNPGVLSTQGEA